MDPKSLPRVQDRAEVDVDTWNPPAETLNPDPATHQDYQQLQRLYRELYPATRDTVHALAERQRRD